MKGWTRIVRVAPGTGERYVVKIDDADLPVYERNRWQKHAKGLIRYRGRGNVGSILLHREILNLRPDQYVLFRNDDKFDVRRSNLRIVSYVEQRQQKKKPFIRTRTNGRPSGVYFVAGEKFANGRIHVYPAVGASFCYQRKERNTKVTIKTHGLAEAVRRVLWWRVDMIRKHGLEPNVELLQMLVAATAEAAKPRTKQREFLRGISSESLYSGNAEYRGCKVVGREVTARFDPDFKPNFRALRKAA